MSSNIVPPVIESDIQTLVDNYYNNIVNVLLDAAESTLDSSNVCTHCSRKRHFWWNEECTTSRNRNRFWFRLWSTLGRPREGIVYETYKYSQYMFRRLCRLAVNDAFKVNLRKCGMYFRLKRI